MPGWRPTGYPGYLRDPLAVTGTLGSNFWRLDQKVSTASIADDTVYAFAVPCQPLIPITSLLFQAGSTLFTAPTHWWFAIANQSRVLQRQSADQLTAAWAANGVKNLTTNSLPVTAAALQAGTVYRYTYVGPANTILNGDVVTTVNCSVAGYNVSNKTVVAVGANTFDIDIGSNPAAFGTGGTVQIPASTAIWTPSSSEEWFYGVVYTKSTTPGNFVGATVSAADTGRVPITDGTSNTGLNATTPGQCPGTLNALAAISLRARVDYA